MGPAAKATADKLAAAIRAVAIDERHHALAARAETGEFGDFTSPHAAPMSVLHRECFNLGLHIIAVRVENGDFDASDEEADEWAESAEGKAMVADLERRIHERS